MNREQLQKDFFPAEIMLQLVKQEIPLSDKIKLINSYLDKVRDSYDAEVLKIKQHNQLAHIYWMSEHYEEAIAHFEIVVENMEAEDYPSLYSLALNLLIRCNRLLSNYQEAEKYATLAFASFDTFHPFKKLNILTDYADLIADSGKIFDENYISIIQATIDELGFPEKLDDPIETIRSMSKRNQVWNRKLSDWTIKYRESDLDEKKRELVQYIDSCEIGWYKDYALNTLEILQNKKAQG
ncbi:MAG: tetratricopeptide repeat protein [Algoriphagus sp.]|uniref:tetratricopeptide repeat protein n=1 Tax=Algoriphagus sp. TaxID=1872435 RepID=UPI00329845A1